MSTLRKYARPSITPAVAGRIVIGATDGLPGTNPQWVGGFYPTGPFAALRTFVDGDGVVQVYPYSQLNYRLSSDLLLQSPPMSDHQITRAVEHHMRGQFDPSSPYAYLFARFNVTDPALSRPPAEPTPEVYDDGLRNEWGSGAVSKYEIGNHGTFVFESNAGTFGVVGLASPDADVADPSSPEFAFLLRGPLPLQIIERGVVAQPAGTSYQGAGVVLSVTVAGATVTYKVGGTTVRTATFRRPHSAVVYRGIACLFAATSTVRGLSVTELSGASFSIRMPAANGRTT